MHELAICERLVDLMDRALERVQPRPTRVARAKLVVGALHQIVEPTLQAAYASLTAEGPAAGSTLEIQSAPVVGRCSPCGWHGALVVPQFRCGACGSLDLEIVGGKELYLDSIEVIDRGEA